MKAVVLCDDCELERVVPICREHGVGLEAQAFYDPELLTTETSVLDLHQREMNGIELRAVHGPFGDLNPGSFDPMVRKVARNRFELGYEAAVKLEAQHLVFHLGYVPNTSPLSRWVPRCVEFLDGFLQSKKGDVVIHLENMLEIGPAPLLDVVVGVDSPKLDVCLDIGHAHALSTTPVLDWVEALGARIGYVHMHDNHGEEDRHLGFGQGNLPLVDVCEALKELAPEAIWGIETEVAGMKSSLKWLSEKGYI